MTHQLDHASHHDGAAPADRRAALHAEGGPSYRHPDRSDPRCATGCRTLVRHWGQVCADCVRVCGDYLRHNPGASVLDYDAIVARDSYVAAAYAMQRWLRAEAVSSKGVR